MYRTPKSVSDLPRNRRSESQLNRILDLLEMIPDDALTVLDVGARDCYISEIVASSGKYVTAVDIEYIPFQRYLTNVVLGSATELPFPDKCFDLVLCTEVLEHFDEATLHKASLELTRVSNKYLLIGVPYEQDLRYGRTKCSFCGKVNPPWGHQSSFSLTYLDDLFIFNTISYSYVGESSNRTNFLADWLMKVAGYPYGSYSQIEKCIFCGCSLLPAPSSNLKITLGRISSGLHNLQVHYSKPKPKWLHTLLRRTLDSAPHNSNYVSEVSPLNDPCNQS